MERTDTLLTELFFFQAEDGIRDYNVTGVQTCALPIWRRGPGGPRGRVCARLPAAAAGAAAWHSVGDWEAGGKSGREGRTPLQLISLCPSPRLGVSAVSSFSPVRYAIVRRRWSSICANSV